MGSGGSLWVKRPGHEDDRSPASSVEIKNAWRFTSTPHYVLMAWCLVKHRDKFSLPLLLYCFIGGGIAQRYSAGLRAGWSGDRAPAEDRNFSVHHRVQTGSEAHPASYTMGTRAVSLEVKQPGREADHTPPSSAKVKNAWNYTSTSAIRLHAWCSVEAQEQFYLCIISLREPW
jgi:hypothetical protein